MSDQNASRRDNIQASAGTLTYLGVCPPWDENPVGRPCRPSTWLNPAMEHTDSIERDSEYVERHQRCALLRDLTKPDLALLEARIVDGWDYAAIARRLGIPRADPVKRMHRIRTDLRRKARALGADIAATV